MKKKILLPVCILAIIGLIIGFSSTNRVEALVPGVNEMVSVNNTGDGQGGNGSSPLGSGDFNISANGRYVSFPSSASNLVSGDTNSYIDVFVRDLDNNTTSRVSVSASGVQSDNTSGHVATGGQAISETGRYIAFSSIATNLIDGQTIPSTYPQVYLRDTVANTVTLVTQRLDGVLGNGATANVHTVSNDGRFVVWEGEKNTNLNPNGSTISTVRHFYLADLSTRTFTLLSPQDGSGSAHNNGAATSCDGSLTVLSTTAQLDISDTDALYDVYLIDIRNGLRIKNITSLSSTHGFGPSISCNGNYLTFTSKDTVYSSVVPSGNSYEHLYLYERINETFTIVDTTTSGTLGNQAASRPAGVDNQGNVVFSSGSTNFGSLPVQPQFYLKNRSTGSLELVSRTMHSPGTASNGVLGKASLSADGKRAVYSTGPAASSLYAPVSTPPYSAYDNNGAGDIIMSLTGL